MTMLPPPTPGAPVTPPTSGPTVPARIGGRRLYAALGALVVAAAGAGAFFALRDQQDKPKNIDGAAMLAGLNQVMDTAKEFPDEQTATCPFGDIDDFAQKAPASLNAVETARGEEESSLFEQGSGRVMVCGATTTPKIESIAVFAGTPFDPTDPAKALISGSDRTVSVGKNRQFRGGTLASACGPAKDDAADMLCDAIWFSGGVQLGVAVRGGKEVVAEAAEQWLEAVLDDLVKGVTDADVTTMKPSATPGAGTEL